MMIFAYLQWALWGIGIALLVLVLTTLWRNARSEFRLLFIYVTVLLVTTLTDIIFVVKLGRQHKLYPLYFWCVDLLRHSALFATVVSFAIERIPEARRQASVLRFAFAGAFLFWLGSLSMLWDPNLDTWMVRVIRNLSFGSSVLILGVWFLLISDANRDTRRLLLVGGLGVQMTGEAMGQSIRQIFSTNYAAAFLGGLLVILTHQLCLIIWLQALRRGKPLAHRTAGNAVD